MYEDKRDRVESYPEFMFSLGLDREVLEEILQKIDENLATRSLLYQDSPLPEASLPNHRATPFSSSILPPPPNFAERITEIRNAQAPYYVLQGNPLIKLIKRLHNLVLKVFGRKQAYFNRLTLDLLDVMSGYLSLFYEYSKTRSVLESEIIALVNRLDALEEKEQRAAAMLNQWVAEREQDRARLRALEERQQQVAMKMDQWIAEREQDRKWLEHLSKEVQGLPPWIDIIARKVEMLSLNVRELSPVHGYAEWPEPRIVDPEKYTQLLSEMRGQIRINLGCGEKPLPGYINVDLRPLPDVDIVADVRRLPFDPGSVFEISSAHLVEHFREHHFRTVVLPYWKSLLMPGGQLRIICPNWAAMLEQLNAGRMPLSIFKRLTFGAQDYEGDDHFAMYTPESLEKLLLEAGFREIEKIVLDRMNGECPEMELLAHL
jgi:hypothetical protein